MATKLSQHDIRKIAVQYLYSLELRPDQAEDYLLTFILEVEDRELSEENIIYFEELISAVKENKGNIDVEISKFLNKNWTIQRLTVIDRIILRLAVEEILNSEIPVVIIIDEALNLAKDFSDPAASKLINGILTNFVEK
ncbi:MAG: transcription antitermination factor NusB [Lactovum sp.]